jgi:3-isopropylmalate/(R)-2-methylmalate dehydratase large subunit
VASARIDKRPPEVRIDGRVLYLTEDSECVRQQLAGADLDWDPERPLRNNISTDEITPGWVCFYYDETLAEYVYIALRDEPVTRNSVKDGGFQVVVSGISKGCGSSRETAPYAELWAGLKVVVARSVEKIYEQNCQNIGLLVTTDLGVVPRLLRGDAVALDEFTAGLDPISREIVEYGGLFNYNKARLAGQTAPPPVTTAPRPMTLAEKLIAKHAIADASTGRLGVEAVAPGDALFVRTDVRFTHEYVTPMAESLFRRYLGDDARVSEPESVYAFRDHLTFLGQVMPKAQKDMGLLERADGLAKTQEDFTTRQGIRLYGEVAGGGSEAICHNAVLEDIALPGQVVVGSDSHTCTAGALGCFAFGVGSTDIANAWYTRDVRVKVPETVRFWLVGEPSGDICGKDVMLAIMATDYIRAGHGIGKVLEFAGPAIASMSIDERATLTNMAVEAGAFTGIIEADEVAVAYLAKMRGLAPAVIREGVLRSDEGAEYAATFEIDLSTLRPMVATPGDPRNGVFIDELGPAVKVDIAYGGSCTGGKMDDMDMYARVLSRALEQGRTVSPDVRLFIQFGSQRIRKYAEEQGYIDVFEKAGARLVNPSCGACIKAGPGVSIRPDEVTVSAINRNFPGRSGPGRVYLASPLVVAASAVVGHIATPEEAGLS